MINEYILNPYPRRMWVAIGENFDEIKSRFRFRWKEDNDLTQERIEDNYDAIVFRVSKDSFVGFLVFITKDYSLRTLVHESVHVAMNIYEDCDMDIKPGMDQEPLCYLIEYIYSLLEESVNQNEQDNRSKSGSNNE